jgi:serine/threonine protein phosphatase PrpC
MIRTRWGSLSITGNFRENNEDRCLASPDGRYFLVADGMGGQSAGEKASELAVELIPRKLDQVLSAEPRQPDAIVRGIDEAVAFANGEIMALGEVDPDYHNMGTTVAFLVDAGGAFYVGGIGDSRVYLLRGGRMQQLTTDHSLTQALVDAGTISPDEAPSHRYRNVLYRYLGTKEGGGGTGAKRVEPQAGDRFLLCSDGVSDGLPADAILPLLGQGNDPQQAAEQIVAAAQAGGSKDNITCVVVFVE